MKRLLIVSAGVVLAACSNAQEKPVTSGAEQPLAATTTKAPDASAKTAAVMIYADWCGSCKVLDPKIEAIRANESFEGLQFVTLDYTAKDSDAFYAAAQAAGVGEAVELFLDGTIKTGQLLLVDLDDKTVIGKVTKDLEPSEIISQINVAIEKS